MFNDITKPPPPLPVPKIVNLNDGISLLNPMSRRGRGPGLILLLPDADLNLEVIDGVPSQFLKWAEEGYTVVGIQANALRSEDGAREIFECAIQALRHCDKCEDHGRLGLVVYDPGLWNYAVGALPRIPELVGAVVYCHVSHTTSLNPAFIPVLRHLTGESTHAPVKNDKITEFHYPGAKSHLFANPFHHTFDYWTESLSHTRTLAFLKPLMNGPYFDLETIWDEHTYYEFSDRSVEHTMSTMVDQPYVNHIPTLTGGIGRDRLTQFYRHNFIFNNSADTNLDLISRTIGIDRIVDEFIFKFTHDKELDWMLPGVPPTNRHVEIPFTAVVNIRGDRLYHEHISWDQGSVLRQIGLMPEYLPLPSIGNGPQMEYRVPVAGVESATKLKDRNLIPSNEMFTFHTRESPV